VSREEGGGRPRRLRVRRTLRSRRRFVPRADPGEVTMDYRGYPILYVDDEPTNLQAMEYLLDDKFTLITTPSGEQARQILAEQPVAVLIADMRMPGMNGAELCARAREIKPDVVRMIMTAYVDVHAAVESINRGQISRYISKPYKKQELLE